MVKCEDCGRRVKNLYPDRRDPPLEIGNCLCAECADGSLQDEIARLEDEIRDRQRELETLRKRKI